MTFSGFKRSKLLAVPQPNMIDIRIKTDSHRNAFRRRKVGDQEKLRKKLATGECKDLTMTKTQRTICQGRTMYPYMDNRRHSLRMIGKLITAQAFFHGLSFWRSLVVKEIYYPDGILKRKYKEPKS